MIEQFARVLAKILAHILDKKYDEAEYMIENVYRQYLGINSDLISRFTYRSLMEMQKADPEQYTQKCVVLANMLYLEGRVRLENGSTREGIDRMERALNVFLDLFAEDKSGVSESYHPVIVDIEQLLQLHVPEYDLPADIYEKLTRFRARSS